MVILFHSAGSTILGLIWCLTVIGATYDFLAWGRTPSFSIPLFAAASAAFFIHGLISIRTILEFRSNSRILMPHDQRICTVSAGLYSIAAIFAHVVFSEQWGLLSLRYYAGLFLASQIYLIFYVVKNMKKEPNQPLQPTPGS